MLAPYDRDLIGACSLVFTENGEFFRHSMEREYTCGIVEIAFFIGYNRHKARFIFRPMQLGMSSRREKLFLVDISNVERIQAPG